MTVDAVITAALLLPVCQIYFAAKFRVEREVRLSRFDNRETL